MVYCIHTRNRFIVEHLWQWPKNGTRLEEKLAMMSKCMCLYATESLSFWLHGNSFDELVTRYEEPDSRNRWDSPLFTVIYDDADVPGDKMWDAVILRKPPPPNQSTISVSVMSWKEQKDLDCLYSIGDVSRNQFQLPTMSMSSIRWHWRSSMLS